jgi:hypothetical protein
MPTGDPPSRDPEAITEEHSFDELAKALAGSGVSRRKALQVMGGFLLGTAVASIPGMAWAKPKPGKCNHNNQCPTGQGCCSGTCIDLQSDVNNCGSCGNVCNSLQTCNSGQCGEPPSCICTTPTTCASGTGTCCGTAPGGSPQCYCFTEVNTSQVLCACAQFCDPSRPTCSSSAECPSGSFCGINPCCGGQQICMVQCGNLGNNCPPPG